jgi:hypothetical protein
MKFPKPAELHPRIVEIETKRNKLQTEKAVKVAECATIRARIQIAPSSGNATDNRVRALLQEPLLADTAPDMPRLEALLVELHDLNKAIGILDHAIYNERIIGSKLVCDSVKPEVTKRATVFAQAIIALHTAHTDYDSFIDEIETSGTNVASLHRIFLSHIGSPPSDSRPNSLPANRE